MSKQVNQFWWRWLVVVLILTMIFGLSFVLIPKPIQQFYDAVFFGITEDTLNQTGAEYVTFLYTLAGSLTFAWAVMIAFTVFGSFRRGEREGWNALTASIVLWYIIDSGASIYTGFAMNAVANTPLFIMFAIPLAATYRDFYPAVAPLETARE